jgi:cation:H+ antiporter
VDLVWIAVGAALLWAGGEALVAGARALAIQLGVQPLVIGLTVVAFGTSVPELAATLTAALQGAPEIAFGNVVGSNIANLGLVLGLAALIAPLYVKARFLAREVPFMIASSVLMMVFAWNGQLNRLEGLALLLVLAGFLFWLLRAEEEAPEVEEEFTRQIDVQPSAGPWIQTAKVVVGIVLLTLGAKALIAGGVGLARTFGIGERVIGLTLVAFGTSLPEVASTVVAAARRESEIIIGNLIGSNIFNICFVLGVSVMVRPFVIEGESAELDLAVMLGFSLLVWPLMLFRRRLGRPKGMVLVILYVLYVSWLFTRG